VLQGDLDNAKYQYPPCFPNKWILLFFRRSPTVLCASLHWPLSCWKHSQAEMDGNMTTRAFPATRYVQKSWGGIVYSLGSGGLSSPIPSINATLCTRMVTQSSSLPPFSTSRQLFSHFFFKKKLTGGYWHMPGLGNCIWWRPQGYGITLTF
jgi:hypothetical protein